jgi:branched-chain amino acid transport system ATP-binding protein
MPVSQEPVLRARGLVKKFGGVTAVDSVDLDVHRDEAVGLIGPNGAGKTTLFNLFAGTQAPSEGRVVFNDADVTGWAPDRRCRYGMARTFQVTLPFENMLVVENAMIGVLARGLALGEARDLALDYLELVGIAHMWNRPAAQLSTGQRKRLELARVMSTEPSLLLLDEVTGGIDQASISGLVNLVRKLHERQITLVVIEHNMAVVREIASRLVFMHQGRIIADGPAGEVAGRSDVRELYLGKARC